MKPEYQCTRCSIVFVGEEYKDKLCPYHGRILVEYHTKCFKVGCTLDATHEIPFGECGSAGLCDKHYESDGEFSQVK